MAEFAIIGPWEKRLVMYRTKEHPDGIEVICVESTMEDAIERIKGFTEISGHKYSIEEVLPDGFMYVCAPIKLRLDPFLSNGPSW